MDLFLLELLALLRPLFFIEVKAKIFGFNLFEAAAIGFSGFLFVAIMIRAAVSKDVSFSALDLFVLAFVGWSVCIYAIYADKADIKEVAKLIIPLLTYTVGRNLIPDKVTYQRVLLLMIIGFLPPMLLSAALISLGQSVTMVSYWTGEPRYSGVYSGAHNMSHNAALLIMLTVIYVVLGRTNGVVQKLGAGKMVLFTILLSTALYSLYAGRVRTTILGLAVFFGVYLFFRNKKLLFISAGGLIVIGIILSDILMPRFFYDVELVSEGRWEASKLGSNRPNIWQNKINDYLALPLDQKIAGIGIGNKLGINESPYHGDSDNYKNSHNDFLEVFIQTGPIGFVLFLTIWVLLLQSIRRLPADERHVMLAFFIAVSVMNFVSNSYVSRFGLAQMFYLAMTYVGLTRLKAGTTGTPQVGVVPYSAKEPRSLKM